MTLGRDDGETFDPTGRAQGGQDLLPPAALKSLLDSEAERINSAAFIADDPVQFPRRFEDLADIELTALLCATIAWGNRKMICRDCDRMLQLMDHSPRHFMMTGAYEDLPPGMNIHRTFFVRHLRQLLRGLRPIYARHGTLQEFARARGVDRSPWAAWELVRALNGEFDSSGCLPQNLDTTALKRVNMALRWLVRRDGIVDMGVWDVLKPSQLFIPLDVHVARTARELGLLTRRTPDRKAVGQIMDTLRRFRPDDPVAYDFALFGIGMNL